jgi:hypothetical protein
MKSLEYLNDDSHPEELEEDWIRHFFERCRLSSDSDMQTVWAKILAGAANSPGLISRKTIDLVGTLEKSDAQEIAQFFNTVIEISRKSENNEGAIFFDPYCVIPHVHRDAVPEKYSPTFNSLSHLEDLGIIRFTVANTYYTVTSQVSKSFSYNSKLYSLDLSNSNSQLNIGHALLTKNGKELYTVIKNDGDPTYFYQIVKFFSDNGYHPCCSVFD